MRAIILKQDKTTYDSIVVIARMPMVFCANKVEKFTKLSYNALDKSEFEEKMKTLYLIGGTMGVGKTTVCQQLKKELDKAVFLDGDWCWDANPFQVTEETKLMVLRNICFLLNSFLHCSAYENVIFCWVMHEQSIIDTIIRALDTENCKVVKVSLMVDENNLRSRLQADVNNGLRADDVIERSIARIGMYQKLDTIKIDTSNKAVCEITNEIMMHDNATKLS